MKTKNKIHLVINWAFTVFIAWMEIYTGDYDFTWAIVCSMANVALHVVYQCEAEERLK